MQVKLVVTNRGTKEEKTYKLSQNAIVFGRAANCDVVLEAEGVSRRHAHIIVNKNLLEIEDLGSGNGTLLNQERITARERIPLKKGDQIRIEEFTIAFEADNMANLPQKKSAPETKSQTADKSANFEITDPDILEIKMIKKILGAFDHDKRPALIVVTTPFQNLKAFIEDEEAEFFVGRDPKCQLAIDSQTVSRKHARLTKKWGSFVVTDLGSKNGTYVNGEKIEDKAIADGDEIVFGTIKVLFKNPQEFDIETISRSMTEEQKAHDKIQQAALVAEAEQKKQVATKPEASGPSDQAKLSVVPNQEANPPEEKKSSKTAEPTKAEPKKTDVETGVKIKTDKNDPPEKEEKSQTKTSNEKPSAGLIGQFSVVEFALLGFGVVVFFALVAALYFLLK